MGQVRMSEGTRPVAYQLRELQWKFDAALTGGLPLDDTARRSLSDLGLQAG